MLPRLYLFYVRASSVRAWCPARPWLCRGSLYTEDGIQYTYSIKTRKEKKERVRELDDAAVRLKGIAENGMDRVRSMHTHMLSALAVMGEGMNFEVCATSFVRVLLCRRCQTTYAPRSVPFVRVQDG